MTGGSAGPPAAAFFDVDGTLAKTTVVDYYVYFRRSLMPPWAGRLWLAAFAIKCLWFLVLDRIDRNRFNRAFYRGYAGLEAAAVKALAAKCHRDVTARRLFREAAGCIMAHRHAKRRIVLVTGSLDFIVEPLAQELGADDVLAACVVERDGRFTGELTGPPLAGREKARVVQQYAETNGIDLAASFAYGDSIADLPMLEAVGRPQTVNADRRLDLIARARRWPIHRWTTPG